MTKATIQRASLPRPTALGSVHEPQRVHHETLPNGLVILAEEMPSVRSAALGFWVRTGSVDEPAAKAGVTHFIEHLLFKRTRRRTNRQISQLIDRLGGDVDAFTSKESTAFYARVEGRRVPEVLDLLADLVRSPAFDQRDFESERKVVLEEIAMVEDAPEELATELFVQKLWRRHPLGRPVLGTPATIAGLTAADVHDIHRRRFVPPNLVFAAAGDVEAEKLSRAVQERFGDLGGRARNRRLTRAVPKPHLTVRTRSEMEQVQVLVGFDGPTSSDELRYAATLLNVVLGGGVSSRLFTDLREKRGLVYSCGSYWSAAREGGYQCVFAGTRKENLRKVLLALVRTVRRVLDKRVGRAELARAKENLLASFLLGLESTAGRMSALARHEFHFGRIVPIDEIVASMEAVTVDDLHRAAERLFRPETLSVTLVGPIAASPLDLEELRAELRG